jgi:hypothetical protein
MAVVIRSSVGDDTWNEWSDQLDACIVEEDANKSQDDAIVSALANEKKSNRFGEKGITIGGLDNFAVKAESANAAEDSLEEGYDKIITHYSFAKSVVLSKELADDNNVDLMRVRARSLVKAYKRTRAQYITDVITKSVMTSSSAYNTTMTFGGQSGIDITTPDGMSLFNNAHPLHSDKTVKQSNIYTNAFGSNADILNVLANKMRNFTDENGNVLGIVADTIVIPGNVPDLEDTIKKIIGSDGEVGTNYNDINTQRGKWKLVIDHLWTVSGAAKPYIIMSSEANKDLMGTMFYNRLGLDVKSEVKTESRNLLYNGFSRWSAGFYNWRHMIMGGAAFGTTLS